MCLHTPAGNFCLKTDIYVTVFQCGNFIDGALKNVKFAEVYNRIPRKCHCLSYVMRHLISLCEFFGKLMLSVSSVIAIH